MRAFLERGMSNNFPVTIHSARKSTAITNECTGSFEYFVEKAQRALNNKTSDYPTARIY